MQYWRNPDEDIRQLERRFRASGGLDDAGLLFNARMRTSVLSPSDIELLAVLGFKPAQDVFPSLGRKGKPKWNAKTLWQEQGQYRGYRLALAGLKFTLKYLFGDAPDIDAIVQKLDVATVETYDQVRNIKPSPEVKARIANLEKDIVGAGAEKDWGGRHFLFDRTRIPLSMIAQHTALSNLFEIRSMLAPAKLNTFYKIGNSIMNNAILTMSSTINEPRSAIQTQRVRARNNRIATQMAAKKEKAAMAKLYDQEILPEALRLVLLTASSTPTVHARSTEYYQNEIKAGRFTNISVASLRDDCPVPKRVKELWGDNYVRFVVWTSSKPQAKLQADKVLYQLFGYIPHYSVYVAGYKSDAMHALEDELHETALFPEGLPDVPKDAISLFERSQFLPDAEMITLRSKESKICGNIAKLRPDLY